MWPRLCVAITVIRRRDVPGGTVGGRIPCANTPCSKSFCENCMQLSASPTISGNIGLCKSLSPKPSRFNPSDKNRQFSHNRSRRSGSRATRSMAAMAMAIIAGGNAVVKMKLRQRLIKSAISQPILVHHAGSRAAENARRMGFIHHHHRVVSFGKLDDSGQRRLVAVHAENRLGNDHTARSVLSFFEIGFELIEIAMTINEGLCA